MTAHSKPTQAERVLRALERAGRHGVTQVDFDLPDVIDGGPPIKRVAARVHELREQHGHRITEHGRRHKCVVYVLAPQGSASRPPAGSSPVAVAEMPRRLAGGREAAARIKPLSRWWACLNCGTRTNAPDPGVCCPDMLAVRVGVLVEDDHECARCDVGYTCREAA